ncbi:MAG: AgmX/PglI C-terminal domain-containing protein, partial [bacterium]
TFEEIKERKEPEKIETDDARWKKVTERPSRNTGDVPRKRTPEDDRKIATESGILKLLKEHGGGEGGGTVFGGVQASSLDDDLDGLQRTGMGPAGGFAGLGTRDGPGSGGGPGLGLGGDGWNRPGGPGGPEGGRVSLDTRGRKQVVVDRKRTRIVGGLKPEVVGRTIQRYYSQIKHCYDAALGRAPNLYGKLTTNFVIAANGRVSEAGVLQSTLGDPTVESCVLRTLRRIRFPEPRGGGEVIVTYPFLFTQAGN